MIKKIFIVSVNQNSRFVEYKLSFVINKNVLNKIFQKNIAERILKKILLLNTVKLFEIVQSEVDERFLNAFNNAVAFILDINDYTASIYVYIKILNILRYKVNNTRSTLNDLMLIITELKNVHEKDKNKICLKH